MKGDQKLKIDMFEITQISLILSRHAVYGDPIKHTSPQIKLKISQEFVFDVRRLINLTLKNIRY